MGQGDRTHGVMEYRPDCTQTDRKTVLLDRLVNTVFFKPEYQVAPFYFKMTREKRTLRKFLLEYATTFFRQYLAYCEQDPALFRNKKMKLEELLTYQTTHKAGILAQESIQAFLETL
jgi:hypothetical protein